MRIVNYYRVSTAGQGRSGLGLEAQRAAVAQYCGGRDCEQIAEFTEIESGKVNTRPELAKALHLAKVTGATLVVAKLDRLSRNAAFLLALKESSTQFVAADMPEANSFTVGIMALVAQQEREAISRRTREALAAAKARGTKLGNPNGATALAKAGKGNAASVAMIRDGADRFAADIMPIIADIRTAGGTSLRAVASELNRRGIVTRRGGEWHAATVHDLIGRAALG